MVDVGIPPVAPPQSVPESTPAQSEKDPIKSFEDALKNDTVLEFLNSDSWQAIKRNAISLTSAMELLYNPTSFQSANCRGVNAALDQIEAEANRYGLDFSLQINAIRIEIKRKYIQNQSQVGSQQKEEGTLGKLGHAIIHPFTFKIPESVRNFFSKAAERVRSSTANVAAKFSLLSQTFHHLSTKFKVSTTYGNVQTQPGGLLVQKLPEAEKPLTTEDVERMFKHLETLSGPQIEINMVKDLGPGGVLRAKLQQSPNLLMVALTAVTEVATGKGGNKTTLRAVLTNLIEMAPEEGKEVQEAQRALIALRAPETVRALDGLGAESRLVVGSNGVLSSESRTSDEIDEADNRAVKMLIEDMKYIAESGSLEDQMKLLDHFETFSRNPWLDSIFIKDPNLKKEFTEVKDLLETTVEITLSSMQQTAETGSLPDRTTMLTHLDQLLSAHSQGPLFDRGMSAVQTIRKRLSEDVAKVSELLTNKDTGQKVRAEALENARSLLQVFDGIELPQVLKEIAPLKSTVTSLIFNERLAYINERSQIQTLNLEDKKMLYKGCCDFLKEIRERIDAVKELGVELGALYFLEADIIKVRDSVEENVLGEMGKANERKTATPREEVREGAAEGKGKEQGLAAFVRAEGEKRVLEAQPLVAGPINISPETRKLNAIIVSLLDDMKSVTFEQDEKGIIWVLHGGVRENFSEMVKKANFNHLTFTPEQLKKYEKLQEGKAFVVHPKSPEPKGSKRVRAQYFRERGPAGVSVAEKEALNIYTGSSHLFMKPFLVGDFKEALSAFKNQFSGATVNAMMKEMVLHNAICISGLNKLPDYVPLPRTDGSVPCFLFRGEQSEGVGTVEIKHRQELILQGGGVSQAPMRSTSHTKAQVGANIFTLFVNARGKSLESLSQHPNECEVLIPPGQLQWLYMAEDPKTKIRFYIVQPVATPQPEGPPSLET